MQMFRRITNQYFLSDPPFKIVSISFFFMIGINTKNVGCFVLVKKTREATPEPVRKKILRKFCSKT